MLLRVIAAILVFSLAACARPTPPTRRLANYQRAGTVQWAVLSGDLQAAQANARWVALNQPHDAMPASAAPYVETMRTAAWAVTAAPELGAAAQATARLGAACGGCHQALGQGPRVAAPATPPAPSDSSVSDQMTLHLWVLSRMWEGLTGPSDAAWTHGALGLNATPRYQAHVRANGNAAAADSLARRLFALGQQAALAGPADRAELYGELLTTCAGCHWRNRVRLPHNPVD